MLKFILDKNRVVVDPVSLTLEVLRDIYVSDKSKLKEDANLLLTFIHICAQIDSSAPFYKSSPDEVFALTKRELYGDYEYEFKGKYDEDFVISAVFAYRDAYQTPEQEAERIYDKKIHELNALIRDTKIEIKETVVKGEVKYVSNFLILNKMMQDLTKINGAKQMIKNIIKGQNDSKTMMGKRELSYLEKKREELNRVRQEGKDASVDEEEEKEEDGTENF